VAFVFSVIFYATQVEKQSTYLTAGSPSDSSRSIASNLDPKAEFDWEKSMRNQLAAAEKNRSVASLGQAMDPSNELKNRLYGYSTVIFEQGKLVRFESSEEHDFNAFPQISLEDLCSTYKNEMIVSFDSCSLPSQPSENKESTENVQVVDLLDSASQVVGSIKYLWIPGEKLSFSISSSSR
jgi:hypothetical protein